MLMDKPEIVVEPPAQPPDAPCPDSPKSEHQHHRMPGHAYEAGYGAAHCLKLLATQCACYNSGLDGGLSESVHGYTNKPPAEPRLSEGVLWPSASLSQPETRLQLGEPPIVSLPRSCYPK